MSQVSIHFNQSSETIPQGSRLPSIWVVETESTRKGGDIVRSCSESYGHKVPWYCVTNSIKLLDEQQNELFDKDVVIHTTDTEEEAIALHKEDRLWSAVKMVEGGRYQTGYSRFGELAVLSIRKAGEHLQLRCPLGGEYILGRNWAECH